MARRGELAAARDGNAVDDGEARIDARAVARIDVAIHGSGEGEAQFAPGVAVKFGDQALRRIVRAMRERHETAARRQAAAGAMREQELLRVFVDPKKKVPKRGVAFWEHFLEGFMARRDLAGRPEFRETCESRNERVVGGDLQTAIGRIAAVEELQDQRVQDRQVGDAMIGGQGIAKAERVIGGQLGHEFVGKLATIVVGRGREGSAVHGAVAFIGRSEIAFAAGGGRAGCRLGKNVGMTPVAALDQKRAVAVDADEGPGLGFLFV